MRVHPEGVTIPPDGKSQEQQPKWRQDFPIDIPQDEYISRRDFAKFMVLISSSFVAGQFWILFQNFFRRMRNQAPLLEIARVSDIPVSGFRIFEYPEKHNPCVLVRTADGEFSAYSQRCTHLSSPVIPEMAQAHFRCPCHEGYFDLRSGAPLAGPPRRALTRVRLERKGDRIYAAAVDQPV